MASAFAVTVCEQTVASVGLSTAQRAAEWRIAKAQLVAEIRARMVGRVDAYLADESGRVSQ